MINFNPNKDAPIFQSNPSNTVQNIPQLTPPGIQPNTPTHSSKQQINSPSDPFEKLINKSIKQNENKPNQLKLETNLEEYKKQIENLDLDQLRMERKRLVDLIVKYMNEGNLELLEETQKKYKIAVQVSDEKVNFSASAIANKNDTPQTISQKETKEDFLKKLQESEILPPDNSPPPTIPQQTSISQQNNIINTTDTNITSANPNVQIISAPLIQGMNQGFSSVNQLLNNTIPSNQVGFINTLNTMPANQLNTILSNPQGMFNSISSLTATQGNNLVFNFPMNPLEPVHPYSPLMTSYGVYAPNLRKNPTMDAFLNGELYPTDMAELGVWSVLNRELFKKTEE